MQPPNQRLTTILYNIRIGISLTASIALSAFILGIVAIIIKSTPTTDVDIINDIFNNITQVVSFTCTNDTSCVSFGEVFTCSTSFCNLTSNRCEFELLPTSQCQTSSDCEGTFICNQCQCISPIPPNVTVGCLMDSDCPNFNMTNECFNTFCNIETMHCFSNYTSPDFNCNGDDSQCGDGEVCQGCQCVNLCSMVTCQTDACQESECDTKTGECQVVSVTENCCTNTSSCPTQTWSECIEYECGMNNTCDQVRIPGAECVMDEDCNDGEACSSCMCVPDPPQFSDEEFALTNGSDSTTTGTFSLQSVSMGSNIQLEFPNLNGTIALISDIPDDDFSDDTFRITSALSETNQLAFDVSAVIGTRTVTIPNTNGLMILGETKITGIASYTAAPIGTPLLGYSLERHQGVVTLWLDENIGTAAASSRFQTTVFIPLNMRPSRDSFFLLLVVSNNANQVGLMTVSNTGIVTIFATVAGGNFASTGQAGIRATAVSWIVS